MFAHLLAGAELVHYLFEWSSCLPACDCWSCEGRLACKKPRQTLLALLEFLYWANGQWFVDLTGFGEHFVGTGSHCD